ncbi:R3H and coiled-coil domain-containing protein 1 isoform 1-T2 [Pholidichthys leucotaenia]
MRYLIHRTVEDLPALTTFSVGESFCRRVVVCPFVLRGELNEDSDLDSSSLCEEPLSCKGKVEGNVKPKLSTSTRSRGPKRPDQPLYMPRVVRERLSLQNSQPTTVEKELLSTAGCNNSFIDNSSDGSSCPESKESTHYSSTSDKNLDPFTDSSAVCSQEEKHKIGLYEDEEIVWDQDQFCCADVTKEEGEKDNEDHAHMPYSVQMDDGDIDDVAEDIKLHLKGGVSVSIEHAHNDYSSYETVFISMDDFRHVIEIYNFPAVFKTDDLLDAFTEYSEGGMKIKWIDNTHALGVFSSESAALHALSICHPMLKARALSEGSKKAQGRAIRRAEFIQPVKARPRTDCVVARRMVTRALGIQGRGRAQRY